MSAVLPPIPLHCLVICEGQLLQGFCDKGPVAGFLLYLLYTDEVDRAPDAANAVSV